MTRTGAAGEEWINAAERRQLNDRSIIFQELQGILRVLIVGLGACVSLIVVLRVTGKRTLSKMKAFDFVVTVALGSTLATVLLSKDVALAEGVAAFTLLVLLQYFVTFASVRSSRFRGLETDGSLSVVPMRAPPRGG